MAGGLSVVPRANGTLELRGELDLASCEQLERAVHELGDRAEIVLDLAGLSFVDGTGVHAFARIAAARPRGTVVLRSPTRHVARVLEILRLEDLAGIRIERANRETALDGDGLVASSFVTSVTGRSRRLLAEVATVSESLAATLERTRELRAELRATRVACRERAAVGSSERPTARAL